MLTQINIYTTCSLWSSICVCKRSKALQLQARKYDFINFTL